ncbi:SWIM zinc finger family protein [Actinoallomurus rhizosphaericola]|uniref:SWIM zinc finger family protein n=1 Tax=Actinoallomurus rhizosphaericola TaxID=2952536 RepID=UPI0020906B6C|nr:SWIM zinc finger family protein [Actinoallomurus rhizosphaericola]MCO5991941.1 SWIM zinc finger family protein [Actinoallomurus rhizosphaericola]
MPIYGKARPVEGGLKAKSSGRGSIGEEWWSRRFIDVLESFADRGRLTRGRTYARKGQVMKLRIDAYEVTALVQGSDPEPYEVSIGIDPVPDTVWESIEQALASQAVFRARLLAGEMPPEIEDVFAIFGVSLFPQSSADMHLMCSCPDWGDPCKHTAAVLYLLAEAFDDDPFLILAWHGRTKDDLLAGLRRLEPAEVDPLTIEETPLAERMEDFWAPAVVRDRPPAPPVPPALLLRLLDPPKVKVRRRDLIDVLKPAYEALPDLEQPE